MEWRKAGSSSNSIGGRKTAKAKTGTSPKPKRRDSRLASELRGELDRRTHELREAREQQDAAAEILQVINSSPGNLAPVFDCILEKAHSICGAPCGSLQLFENDRVLPVAIRGMTPSFDAFLRAGYPITDGIRAGVISINAIQYPDIYKAFQNNMDATAFRAAFELGGIRTLLTVPLVKNGAAFGRIVAGRKEVRPFTERQIVLLQGFAAQAAIAIENARLFNETKEALAQQTATAEILEVINSSPTDLAPVFDAILQRAHALCGIAHGSLQLFDGECIRAVALHAVEERFANILQRRRPAAESPAVQAFLQGERYFQIDDARNADVAILRASAEFTGTRTVLNVPLRREGKLLGMIVSTRREVKPFTDKEISLLESFAAQAAIAIENARLFEEVQAKTRDLEESLQQQTATADVLKVISRSTFDLQLVLDTLVESAARLCEADRANIWRPSGPAYRLAAVYQAASSQQADYLKELPLEAGRGSCLGRTLLARDVIQIEDIHVDPDYAVERSKLEGYRTMLGVPLLREGAPIGVIVLVRSRRQTFSVKQIELVKTFADQAVIAIENVRLFDEVQARTRELTKSLEELRTTQDRLVQTQKLALLGQLTAGIAHEIKNPLNFVNNFSGISAELIDELRDALKGVSLEDKARAEIEELADMLKGNFDKVVHHGRRADAIVKNMLQHSREGSGEHRTMDINALVEESLNLAWHGARAETQGFEIKLKQSFDPSAGGADVFPQDIRRALLNLIANGFYATKRKAEAKHGDYEPTLTASTKNLGDHVEIRIRDNGTGITPDVKEKMLEPFFTTKPTGEGTGLGLSISHDIVVKQHAGTIEVDTQPGAFTEIRIILPRTPAFV